MNGPLPVHDPLPTFFHVLDQALRLQPFLCFCKSSKRQSHKRRMGTPTNGGSKVSHTEVLTQKGRQPTVWPFFPENYMEMKKLVEGARVPATCNYPSPLTPATQRQIRQCQHMILQNVPVHCVRTKKYHS